MLQNVHASCGLFSQDNPAVFRWWPRAAPDERLFGLFFAPFLEPPPRRRATRRKPRGLLRQLGFLRSSGSGGEEVEIDDEGDNEPGAKSTLIEAVLEG